MKRNDEEAQLDLQVLSGFCKKMEPDDEMIAAEIAANIFVDDYNEVREQAADTSELHLELFRRAINLYINAMELGALEELLRPQ